VSAVVANPDIQLTVATGGAAAATRMLYGRVRPSPWMRAAVMTIAIAKSARDVAKATRDDAAS